MNMNQQKQFVNGLIIETTSDLPAVVFFSTSSFVEEHKSCALVKPFMNIDESLHYTFAECEFLST